MIQHTGDGAAQVDPALTSVSHALLTLVGQKLPGSVERLRRIERTWQELSKPL